MYCTKCGAPLDEQTGLCPNCQPVEAAQPDNSAQVQQNAETAEKKKPSYGLKASSKSAKSYAAIFTALMVFPAMICVAVNMLTSPERFWAGYVLGALAVIWVFFVLPTLRITPPAATATICFFTLAVYLLYIAKMSGVISWYYTYAVPICIILGVLVALTAFLVSKDIAKGLHLPALLSAEVGVFLLCLEVICDANAFGKVTLGWSLITLSVFVSLAVLCEAIGYVIRLNKKK